MIVVSLLTFSSISSRAYQLDHPLLRCQMVQESRRRSLEQEQQSAHGEMTNVDGTYFC